MLADAETGPNGIDARYTAKVTTTTSASDQGVSSNLGFINYPTNTSPVPIIRNEELILLRAQANHGLGNLDAASRDLNFVRTRSGNLAPKTYATLNDLLNGSACTTSATRCCTRRGRVGWTCGSTIGWISYRRICRRINVHANYPVPSNEWLARGGTSACTAQ